jgi:hypothetical protein
VATDFDEVLRRTRVRIIAAVPQAALFCVHQNQRKLHSKDVKHLLKRFKIESEKIV